MTTKLWKDLQSLLKTEVISAKDFIIYSYTEDDQKEYLTIEKKGATEYVNISSFDSSTGIGQREMIEKLIKIAFKEELRHPLCKAQICIRPLIISDADEPLEFGIFFEVYNRKGEPIEAVKTFEKAVTIFEKEG